VTTPRTPAGWYADPDGSGGQRYWDGSAWTEHRSPAPHEPSEPSEPTAAAEPPGSEQPTTVVPIRPAGEHVGAHRAPEPEPEPEPTPQPEPRPEPEPGPTAVIDLGSVVPSEQLTTPLIPPTPPAEPSFAGVPLEPPPSGEPPARDDRRQLVIWFGAACAALLAVLVLVVIYGVFIHKDDTIQASSGPSSTSKSATPTTPSGSGWGSGTQTASESPTTASGSGPQATDGGLTFAVTGVETAPSVKYQDAPVEKTAQGEFIIVHMTVLNSGDAQGTFLATLQKLKAGGTTYSIDDEATAYLNGTWADLNAGDTADVAIAFDVPPGTTPESLEVHGASTSTGVEVPLS
jgi:Domain of unknown function (DUF4352)/Protein of unknown function (DUF2510)